MIINKQQMDEINSVQLDIFKAFHHICERLGLDYYLVHGSLLGGVRYKGFFPIDDDIDVAMPRKDYDIFMSQGPLYLDDSFFIQSYLSERDYPLVFGKMRANNTAFIQPILKNFQVNKGIYIDIFPIDNYPTNRLDLKLLKFKEKLYSKRVNVRYPDGVNKTVKGKLIHLLCNLFMPSWERTRDKLCTLYSSVKPTGKIIVRGGKGKEVGIPFDLFGKPVLIQFEGINSYAPEKTSDYLKLIYGDYMNYEPMGKDMVSENEVKISADIIDVHNSYKNFE